MFPYFCYTAIFILGAFIGSFLNVIIYRLHTKEPIVKARSHCPHCGHILEWYELVPIFSFLIQKGKCRRCKHRISMQYPLVEGAGGILFLMVVVFNFPAIWQDFGWALEFSIFTKLLAFQFLNILYLWAVLSMMIVIFAYDLKHYIIPDKILYPAIILVICYKLFDFWSFINWDLSGISNLEFEVLKPLLYSFLAAAGALAFFLSIFLITKGRGLGFGDVKFAFFMGFFLGWPSIIVGLFGAWVLGAIIGIALLMTGKKVLKSEIPFGPFLVTGTFTAMFWGDEIIKWYFGLLGF